MRTERSFWPALHIQFVWGVPVPHCTLIKLGRIHLLRVQKTMKSGTGDNDDDDQNSQSYEKIPKTQNQNLRCDWMGNRGTGSHQFYDFLGPFKYMFSQLQSTHLPIFSIWQAANRSKKPLVISTLRWQRIRWVWGHHHAFEGWNMMIMRNPANI